MAKICELVGVREYAEGFPVALWRDEDSGRLLIVAENEGGNNSTAIDLLDLLEWLRHGAHVEILDDGSAETICPSGSRQIFWIGVVMMGCGLAAILGAMGYQVITVLLPGLDWVETSMLAGSAMAGAGFFVMACTVILAKKPIVQTAPRPARP